MKFVLVNGRSPRAESFCALCCEPIGEGYVRELTTHLCYCNYACHLGHCKIAFSVFSLFRKRWAGLSLAPGPRFPRRMQSRKPASTA